MLDMWDESVRKILIAISKNEGKTGSRIYEEIPVTWSHFNKVLKWLAGEKVNYRGTVVFKRLKIPLVEKKVKDGRSYRIFLTPKGRVVVKKIKELNAALR